MAIDYGMTGVVLDEEVELKNYPLWICEMVHGYPAWTPLFLFLFCEQTAYGLQRRQRAGRGRFATAIRISQ